jgi:RecB family exonuclease
MADFLEQVAEAMLAEHGVRMADVAVVLPSQRAGLYLRRALSVAAGRSLWSPEMLTWTSCMERIAGWRSAGMEELLLEGHAALRELEGEAAGGLPDFLQWAPTLLADMSEVDAALIGLDGFYRDLRSWEELDWSFRDEPLSDGQQRLVRYWERAGRLHRAINERMAARCAGTSGAVERAAAARVGDGLPWRTVWFVGLNAFTNAQRAVVDAAREAGIARFAWDADAGYLKDAVQEAGDHLRKAMALYGPGVVPPTTGLLRKACQLEVVEANGLAAQVWAVAGRVAAMSEAERSRAAVVLAEEAALPLLLEALPSTVHPLNITMGIALAQLPVGSLLTRVLDAFVIGEPGARNAALRDMLMHPLLTAAPGRDAAAACLPTDAAEGPEKAVLANALGEVPEALSAAVIGLLSPEPGMSVPARLRAALRWATRPGADAFLREQLHQAALLVDRMEALLGAHGDAGGPEVWSALLPRVLRSARVGFEGEPLRGLQVMGMLEARALDHAHVFVVGAQEGVLPRSSIERSFIPFELRRAHGLSLGEDTDAVQAYNFFRLMNRADALVVTCGAGDGDAARSRFVEQLRLERYADPSDPLRSIPIRVPVPKRAVTPYGLTLDEEMRARLIARLERGISPSMLRAWLTCPLDMWMRFVLKVEQEEQVGARIPPNIVGDAVHKVLHKLYTPWLGHSLQAAELRSAAEDVPALLAAEFGAYTSPARLALGEPRLQLGMATAAVRSFMRAEADEVERGMDIRPMHLEMELRTPLGLPLQHTDARVIIRGTADRVDLRNGRWHVLDLKTGSVTDSQLKLQGLAGDELRTRKGYAAQLLLYTLCFLKERNDIADASCGLLPLQRSGAGASYLQVGDDAVIRRSMLPAIAELVRDEVDRMLDPGFVYRHDPRSTYCALCAGGA